MTISELQAIDRLEVSKSEVRLIDADKVEQEKVSGRLAAFLLRKGRCVISRMRGDRITIVREIRAEPVVIADSGFSLLQYPMPSQSNYGPRFGALARDGAGMS